MSRKHVNERTVVSCGSSGSSGASDYVLKLPLRQPTKLHLPVTIALVVFRRIGCSIGGIGDSQDNTPCRSLQATAHTLDISR